MSISDRRSWWNRRRNPHTAAALLSDAGHAHRSSLEELESRVLLSDPGSTFAEAQELILDGNGQATYDDDLPNTSDIDMYTFSVSSPDFITILADAVNTADAFDDRVDTQFTLFDYQGNALASAQDSGNLTGGTPIDAWHGFVPTASHLDPDTGMYTYFVAVSAENAATNGALGLYTMRVDGMSTEITLSGNADFTDTDGNFNISHGGNTNVTITADFDIGKWCNINNEAGSVLDESGTATPGVEAVLTFNQTPSEFETAQVNAFIHTGKIHNFITDRSSWTGMDFVCTTNVNINSSCNAFFDGNSINFYRAAGGCNNTAYTTVVAHEYGHYVVNRLGLSQGAFGEGFGDVCAEMLYDTGVVGENFFTNGDNIRDNDNTIRTYPCSGAVHFCGQLLGGVWWHTREEFGDTYGSQAGLAEAQQLFVDWMLITSGGSGDNSAHPGTAIEMLTVDDDDGNIFNGTPNYDDLGLAFDQHTIPYPEIEPLVFSYPDGKPTLISPDGGTTFRVVVTGSNGFDPEPGTGMLHVNTGSGFVGIVMNEITDNEYEAVFPAIDCQSDVMYYVSAEATDGTPGEDPATAPDDFFGAYSAESRILLADLDFETSSGFTVQNVNVESGGWAIGSPFGDGSPDGDYDGSGNCYQTQGTIFNRDLDGGPTRLISPVYDLTGTVDPTVSYARWFNVDNNDEDRLTVQFSSNGGSSWTTVESTRSTGEMWVVPIIHIRDHVELTDSFRIRFNASDNPNDSETEAAIDAFLLEDVDCGGCVADFDSNGTVDTQDVLAFLNAWNASDPSADINGDGSINSQDVLAFLNLWNAGC
jgi:hypothetical protein